VFTALSRREPYLLLPDGACFSLEKPELQRLARLIEEARALQDVPSGPLRISRFQAGWWEELAALGVVTRQAEAWQQQVQGLLDVGAAAEISGLGSRRRRCGRSCARISSTVSAGWRSCGSTASAASSPTTWGSARRRNRWR
jgi:hypothetical protein